MATYKRLPVAFERGAGSWLWDTDGKSYLDAITGIAVCSLGHAHAAVQHALCEQAGTLLHTSNLYGIPLQQRLGDRLTRLADMDRVFFCNSGAEANEAAIKLARLQGHKRGIDNPAIIVMENSFHGRTLATLSATGNRKVQAGFEPLVQGFVRATFGKAEALDKIAASRNDICAVLVEPIQGEGGVNIPPADYLNQVRAICDQHGWLMMLDEIQTGMARTGRHFAHQHNGIQPDVMTLAKALGNGMPIGACLARGQAAELFGPGSHGSTFGGNPLACSAAMAVLDTLAGENIAEAAALTGARLKADLQAALTALPGVIEVRGQGMIIGIALDRPCTELVGMALAQGLLINVTAERVIRLLPPLNISPDDTRLLCDRLSALIREFLSR
jgi:acetylornithine/N-succinyldiaminopimelate aminotransferase